ncbi:MAG TPA: hypothetical protein VEG32_07760 [Clostridia bacterium]|nr:hypothetical protein [Clostridia bacterium]
MDKAGYFVALDSVTRYGLSTAVRSILQGALNHGFFPSPPELRKQCDAAMEHHERMAEKVRRRERENAEFNRIHGGPFPERTEDGRRRVQEAYRAYLDSHQSASESEMEAARAEIRARYGMTEEVLAGIKDRPTARQGA